MVSEKFYIVEAGSLDGMREVLRSKAAARILCEILSGYATTKELAERLNRTPSTVSGVLEMLRKAGLVEYTAVEGKHRFHGIVLERLAELFVEEARELGIAIQAQAVSRDLLKKLWGNKAFQRLVAEFLSHYYRTVMSYGRFNEALCDLIDKFEDELCRIVDFIEESEDMDKEEREALKLLKEWSGAVVKPYETYAMRKALEKALKVKMPQIPMML